jgi:hypothetical protein
MYMLLNTANVYYLRKVTFMLTRFNTETKTYKLFSALHSGESVSASQAEKRFGIKNISAEVSRIRQGGFAVYANSRKAGNGVQVTEYKIGRPSRKLIAAGYKAMALGLV